MLVSVPEAAPDPLIGNVIGGKFRVERLLGAGAMGRVYLAEQTNLGKQVAIKVLRGNLAGDSSLERRFAREAKSASALSHPNIVQTIDFGEENGLLFIAMELLSGRDLGKAIRAEGPFSPERTVHIAGQVLSALEEAHEKGIVHRDLKPENIMLLDVRGEEFVKVCDFGIAKATSERDVEGSALTSAGMVCGTPEYMSPEQARGETLDGRSDLYAVACILYQMSCSELPFRAETTLGVVTKLLNDVPIPPSKRRPDGNLPAALEALILRGLDKLRERRFANAREMREALHDAIGIKRPASGKIAASSTADRELALAATGVATPISQPALPPATAAAGGSVHGEMAAAKTATTRRNWPALTAGAVVLGLGLLVAAKLLRPAPQPEAPPVAQPAAPPVEQPQAPPQAAGPPAAQPPAAAPAAPPAPPVTATAPEPAAVAVAEPRPAVHKSHHRAQIGNSGNGNGGNSGVVAVNLGGPSTPVAAGGISAAPAAPVAAKPTPVAAKPTRSVPGGPFAEGEQLFKSGDIEGALARYLEAARLEPDRAVIQREIVKCYNRLGQKDRAQPYVKRYLELAPDAQDAAFYKAMLQ
jgi:serine/threonine-protein kinase